MSHSDFTHVAISTLCRQYSNNTLLNINIIFSWQVSENFLNSITILVLHLRGVVDNLKRALDAVLLYSRSGLRQVRTGHRPRGARLPDHSGARIDLMMIELAGWTAASAAASPWTGHPASPRHPVIYASAADDITRRRRRRHVAGERKRVK